jgi:hypothetical protein
MILSIFLLHCNDPGLSGEAPVVIYLQLTLNRTLFNDVTDVSLLHIRPFPSIK